MTSANPSLRDAHAEATRQRLVENALALLERGERCTMRAVAARAGISERTVYRYFQNRAALAKALTPELRHRVGAQLPDHPSKLEGYVRTLFETFEANRALVVGLTTSATLDQDLEDSRRVDLSAMGVMIDRGYPRAPKDERARATASLRAMLSGAGWVYLRHSCGLPNDQVIAAGQWAVRATLERLTKLSGRR